MATKTAKKGTKSIDDAAKSLSSGENISNIKIARPYRRIDMVTIFGLASAVGLILAAILISDSDARFFNGPAFMIVILGTIAATSVAYSGEELRGAGKIIANSIVRKVRNHKDMAIQLMNISMLARKKGLLSLTGLDAELRRDKFLHHAVQLVTDGYSGPDIDRVLGQEVDSLIERHYHSAGIVRRASEIAPAMGLIGTLVGLVQMLANLEDPSTIGPAMALALLTTFYGAVLGTVILGPLAAKLERNSNDEAMTKNLVLLAMASIARQENPRRLEMLLNSELPPSQRIKYFD
jgi:chemotaxis protein MotA